MPFEYDGRLLKVGANVDIRIIDDDAATAPSSSQDPISFLISEVDAAMYLSKHACSGRVAVFGDQGIARPA